MAGKDYVSVEIDRLRRQVTRELSDLSDLPLRPWRPPCPRSRRERAAHTANLVWRRSLQLMRVRA